ncbi:MAG: class I SAM-dependent methyltransferase [Oligoflexia bacterium]
MDLKSIARKLSIDLILTHERIGTHELKITTLRDLNATIDRMFEELEILGKPELLERLCPYFGVVWPSSRALALEVLATAPCRMLEMGCGLAIPSLLATRLGFNVVATDFHPQVERFLEINRDQNCTTTPNSCLSYLEWDWQNASPHSSGINGAKFDWVVGSDLLYARELPVPLANTMANAVAPGGRITITDPARPYLQIFSDELTNRLGFTAESKVVSVPHPKPEAPEWMQEVFVIHFTRANDPTR